MPMASYKPEDAVTLEEFIAAGANITISYDRLSYKEKLSNGTEISILNVINDYLPEIKAMSSWVKLTKEQYWKYKFKPKLLCHDVYGNPELYYIILLLNRIIDVKEFDFKKVKMLKVDYMNILLSHIYNAEKKDIDAYNTDHDTYG